MVWIKILMFWFPWTCHYLFLQLEMLYSISSIHYKLFLVVHTFDLMHVVFLCMTIYFLCLHIFFLLLLAWLIPLWCFLCECFSVFLYSFRIIVCADEISLSLTDMASSFCIMCSCATISSMYCHQHLIFVFGFDVLTISIDTFEDTLEITGPLR